MQQNIAEAKNMSAIDFASAVRSGGKWDYKRQGRQYENFGNYNYGVAGRAAGFDSSTLDRAAGAYQVYSGTSSPEWGWPWGDSPYGDDPNDQAWINEGIRDFDNGYWDMMKCH
jgi:hypothetical protein